MKSMIYYLIVSLFILQSSGCISDFDNKNDLIDFKFRLLNKDGIPSTEFVEGEDIIFSFLIINKTENIISLSQADFTDDFFRVIKLNLNNTTNSYDSIILGKPYRTMFCNYNGIIINKNDTLKLEIPWITKPGVRYPHFCILEDNNPLPAGNYESGFTPFFDFGINQESYNIENQTFKILFTINNP